MSSLSSVNCSLIDSLSRMRITASSPCTLGMIETRKSIVLPGSRSLKRPSCGTRFSAMSSSAITLMREMIALWCCLAIGCMAGCSTPSMRYSMMHRVFARLDVDVARPPLDGGVDRRVDQPDDRADVARQPFDGDALVVVLVLLRTCSCKPSLALSSTRCELSLFLRIDWIADGAPTVTLIGIFSTTLTSSIIGRSVGSETTMTRALPSRAARHEAVAQHQVGGDRAEELLVDPELVHVDELEPVALGELARARHLVGGVVAGREAGIGGGRHRLQPPASELSSKSGM